MKFQTNKIVVETSILLAIIVIQTILRLNLPFTVIPELVTFPWLMMKGYVPYSDFVDQHTPLILYLLIGINSFFNDFIISNIVLTLIAVNITTLVVFLISKEIFGFKIAILSTIFYAIWSIFLDGNYLWYDMFIAPFFLISFFLLHRYFRSFNPKYLVSLGLILSISYLIKQTALFVIFFVFIILLLSYRKKRLNNFIKLKLILIFLIFLTIPYLITVIFYLYQGSLLDYIKWTNNLSFFLAGFRPIVKSHITFLLPLLLPLLYFLFKKFRTDFSYQLIIIFSILALVSLFPRYETFHLQQSLPFLSILFGLFVVDVFKFEKKNFINFKNIYRTILLLIIIFPYFFNIIPFYVANIGNTKINFFEDDIKKVANWIKTNTNTSEKIFQFGLSHQLYYLSEREPGTKYVFLFPSVLDEESAIKDLQKNSVNTIILFLNSTIYTEFKIQKPQDYAPKIYSFILENYKQTDKLSENVFVYRRS